MPKLPAYILHCRESLELTQIEFAEKIGVSKSYLCDLEKSRRNLSVDKALKIAKILNLNTTAFLELIFQNLLDRKNVKLKVTLEPN